jgi:transcriptional antiterminator NusG
MDNTNDLKKEENIEEAQSLDDMMAQSVAPTDDASTTNDADEIQDSTEAPKEESEIDEDATPTATTEENESTETANDMIEDAAEEEKELKSEDTETAKSAPVHIPKQYRGKWYIVHTYSGHENKVAKTLMQRVQAMGFEERIFDALVPTRDTIRVRGGKKETIKEKIFPGYILVNMDLSDEAWVLVRTTPGVTSFVGAQNKPTPIRDDEVQAIVAFVEQKEPVYKAQFTQGEAVKITDGPFSDFLGTVESIDEGKGKVKVLVSIFGRETPVELDFLQVAKI